MIYPDCTVEDWLRKNPKLARALKEWPLEHESGCTGGGEVRPYATNNFVGINRLCKCNASMGVLRGKIGPENVWHNLF